jgi:hypothetical protein
MQCTPVPDDPLKKMARFLALLHLISLMSNYHLQPPQSKTLSNFTLNFFLWNHLNFVEETITLIRKFCGCRASSQHVTPKNKIVCILLISYFLLRNPIRDELVNYPFLRNSYILWKFPQIVIKKRRISRIDCDTLLCFYSGYIQLCEYMNTFIICR